MSSNVWQSEPYLESYKWLLESLPPLLARTKAFSSTKITKSERQTLAGIGDVQEHNEKLLTHLERKQENYPCLVDIVAEMGCEEEAKRLRRAVPPPSPPSPQSPQHLACASAAESRPQPGLPVHHTPAKPGLPQGRQPQLQWQSQSKPPPVPKPRRLPKTPLLPHEPLQPEASHRPSTVYPLDALGTGEAVSEARSLRADTRDPPLVFDVSPSSSDTGIDSDVNEDVMKSIKIFIWREKCNDFDAKHIRHTLKKNFKLKIEREYFSDDSDEEETHVQSSKVAKEQQGDAITTVKIVIGVDELATESQRKEVVARVRESLRWCGINGLDVRCVDDGSIVIYALIPISDLIHLYQVATHYPGVLAGIGILEISTLGRVTVISYKTSPGGPLEEPIHPSLAAFIGDMLPGQAHAITSSVPNMHHAVCALVSNLPEDGEALPKVIKWLEKHRNDVFNTPSLFAMDRAREKPSSGVSSISTTSPSISGEVGDSTTKKSVVVSLSDSRLPSTESENLLSELAEQRSAITEGDTPALQDWQDRASEALHSACKRKQADTVKKLLSLGAPPSTPQFGITALQRAAEFGRADVCKVLLDGGADVNLADENGRTPLHRAAYKGHADVCKVLLDGDADVNLADKNGHTPLLRAPRHGRADVCKVLLDGGADVNLADKRGNTLLLRAAKAGHADVCKVLLDGGADVNLADKDGLTPLERATRYGRANVRKVLLDGGADVNLASKVGGALQRYSISASGLSDPARAESDLPTGNKSDTVSDISSAFSAESGYGSGVIQLSEEMTPRNRLVLQRQYTQLTSSLQLDDGILDRLYSKSIVTMETIKKLRRISNPIEKNRVFLEELMHRGDYAFTDLLEALNASHLLCNRQLARTLRESQ